jgi:glutamate racemase
MSNTNPIGVFDSGIGGLTVVKRFLADLPNENIVYFGDTARVPYGSKSNSTVIDYSIQNSNFLMSKNVKAIVVACNTASSVAITQLKNSFDVPVIGMIDPGAQMAIRSTKNKKVGVIGTRSTINNRAYSKKILEHDRTINVMEKACPLFVPIAEEGWINHKATFEIAEEYLKELKDFGADTLVLGCTHYPILSEVIQQIIGKDVVLIDSGVASAEVVKSKLKYLGLENTTNQTGKGEFYVSDIPTTFVNVAELFLGRRIPDVHKVDIESYPHK